MRRRLIPLLLVPLLFLSMTRAAASDATTGVGGMFYPGASIPFEHFTTNDGLSQDTVLAVLQDRQGYLWIGTQDGLNRYDGYTFTHFKNDPDDPDSLGFNSILALLEDEAGYLWIGTWGGGLNRYDPRTGKFTRYLPDPANAASLGNATVTSLARGPRGRLWVGTLGGLDAFDPASGRFSHFHSDPSDPSTLSSDVISVITPTGDGRLWVGTGALSMPGAGLNLFDPVTGMAERITTFRPCLQSPNISGIAIDSSGSLWIGHGGSGLPGGGLDHFNHLTGNCQHYDNRSTGGQLVTDNVARVLVDGGGRLWVTLWGGGLLYKGVEMGAMLGQIHHDPADPESLSSDNTSAIFMDRSGVLWVGTLDAGINKLNLESLQFRTYRHVSSNPASLASDRVSAFAQTIDGSLWVGTWETGLARFNSISGQFTHYRNIPNDPGSLASNRINALYADPDGTLWVGTFGAGLDHFDPATGSFTHYRNDSANPGSLVADEINYITRDDGGRLWVASMGGLSRLDPGSDRFVNYTGLSGAPVTLMADGSDLWIGTWGGGVSQLRLALPGSLPPPDRTRFNTLFTLSHNALDPNTLSENSVWAVHKTSDRLFWFGTASGLNCYNPSTGEFKVYNELNGLRNASIRGILEDANGFLWVTTGDGLARFDPTTSTFRIFDQSDGLQGDTFNTNAYFISPTSGEFFVGGMDGFTVFHPLHLVSNTTPPSVVVTDLTVFNRPYAFDPLGEAPVRLSYDQDFISFDFAALDFHAPERNSYAYMLEGFDRDWIQAGTNRSISYTSLAAGDYTFRVRGANSDGTWSEHAATLRLQIAPPFWQRWEFRVGLLVGVAALVVAGFQWRLRSARRTSMLLEQRIAERTRELNEANDLLREKATQDAVAAERTRLARDLHDAVTQTLFSATLIADVLPDLWKGDRAEGKRRLEELRQLTRGALAEMRTLLVELRPNALVEIPLPALLRQLTEALIGRSRVNIQLNSEGERRLPGEVQIALYRIAQEALNNVIRHSKAAQAVVALRMGEVVRLTVTDNGVGFDPAAIGPDHLGLRIMAERAEAIGGTLNLLSEPRGGTQVSVTWSQDRKGHRQTPGGLDGNPI